MIAWVDDWVGGPWRSTEFIPYYALSCGGLLRWDGMNSALR
ncbi:MAG: hypothetical protein ACI9TH_000198 [Kiritimatiellia bacterium]|jgi:hypothetical protein